MTESRNVPLETIINENPEQLADNPIEERRQLVQARRNVQELIDQIINDADGDGDVEAMLNRIIKLNGLLIPIQLKEAVAQVPNEARSVAASRTLQSIKDLHGILLKKHQIQTSDDFNSWSPRAKAVWSWMIELFFEIASKHLGEQEISNIFNELASRLVGWEESVDKRLKGVPVKMLPMLRSPFLQDFVDAVDQNQPLELGAKDSSGDM